MGLIGLGSTLFDITCFYAYRVWLATKSMPALYLPMITKKIFII